MNRFLKIIILFLIVLLNGPLFSQQNVPDEKNERDTLVIKGGYSGENVYAVNPFTIINNDTVWTAKEVYVNDQLILTEKQLRKRGFEIPLSTLNLKMGEPVILKIVQAKTGKVKILHRTGK